ncbi:TPA: isoleucine--tRNA ligase [Candidatus Saccharibacteria bacterium]|nr:isoleucine--tRNA ligase [Candidatus Saccharibacteria bacterium]HRK41276.1 isoleucine--tRNA ligase [Candidatus Saccharibacteria bacterium]
MKFKSGTRRRALEYEKDWVQRWKQDKTFEKSVENRPKDNAYVFYDGPPFISGVPHHGTLLSSIVKDAVPRYQTMKGKRVERVWGWDCHGLPAERFTEKKLGIHSRQEVIEYGIEKYINATRANMVQTSGEWEEVVDRIGRWVDFKGAYKTMDKDYMESIWWAFKTLYEKGKIYEGEKVLMYCTLDGTPLSKAEVTMDAGAYQDVTDPSVYVKFKLEDGRTLLAWTTTPWTLPANTAVAVGADIDYVEVKVTDERFILAKELVEKVLTDEKHQPIEYEVVGKLKGKDLVGLSYEPLFVNRGKNAHKVWDADYVSTEDGTGIVHLAPTYGEEDFQLAKEKGFPAVHTIDQNGYFTEGDWKGENVWDINKQIAKDLQARGTVWKIDYIRHSYPHCHRCGTKLMYRAHPSWFMDIEGQRELMLEKNGPIEWFPSHVKQGRFAKTVQSAPDWNISRDRFWATAMPVWKSKSGKVRVVGSYAELKELSSKELDDYHRPWVDDITFEIDGETYTRIDKVMDSWFEAGSMPFAQFHYPFENKQKFEENFPGDFIVEYIGQVRAWFYYMHAMSVALFGENSFKNVIVTGNVAGNDGRKMSKSYGNYTDPNELMDKFSADSLRFLLLSSPLLNGEDFSLQDKDVGDVARKLGMIWNMYDFFTMYAEVDGWEYDGELKDPIEDCTNPLDIWIISRLHQLVADVEKYMDSYNIPDAMNPILPFLDDASNWYVRRSRRRFWKSEDDNDKEMAYRTLHYVLVRLSYVMAPFTPFLAEELYHNLTGDKESVHLKDWLPAGHINQLVIDHMGLTRKIIEHGLGQRMLGDQIKVRQPLKSLSYTGQRLDGFYENIIAEEVNVKEILHTNPEDERFNAGLDKVITPELKREGLMREIIRHVQAARKAVGLNVDDRIVLGFQTKSDELAAAINEHEAIIKAETLTEKITDVSKNEQSVKVEGDELKIYLEKAT